MVAFFVVFGFLLFGAVVVGWATREVWVSALLPARPKRRAIAPTPSAVSSHDPFANSVVVAPHGANSDPFAHAPSMTQPSFTEPFAAASETRH